MVIFAAELLKRANELVKRKVHPTTVITGYRLACREAIKYLSDQLVIKTEALDKQILINIAKTSMSSKIIGRSVIFSPLNSSSRSTESPDSDDEFFANMAVDAMLAVKTVNPRGETKYPVKAVNILKAHGKSATESLFIKGYALNCNVASQG